MLGSLRSRRPYVARTDPACVAEKVQRTRADGTGRRRTAEHPARAHPPAQNGRMVCRARAVVTVTEPAPIAMDAMRSMSMRSANATDRRNVPQTGLTVPWTSNRAGVSKERRLPGPTTLMPAPGFSKRTSCRRVAGNDLRCTEPRAAWRTVYRAVRRPAARLRHVLRGSGSGGPDLQHIHARSPALEVDVICAPGEHALIRGAGKHSSWGMQAEGHSGGQPCCRRDRTLVKP